MPRPKRVIFVLFLTLLLDMVGIGMLLPILPIIFTDPSSPAFLLEGYSTRAQYILAGLLTAVFGFMQFLAAPVFGELSDAYGRKRLLTLGVGILALSHLCFGLGIETGSLAILFASRIISGLAGGNFSIAQASIADVTPPEHRAKNFGLIGVAFGLGVIIGPVLGGWLSSAFDDPAAPFWFATALGILNVIFISLFMEETHSLRKPAQRFHLWKGLHNIRAAWTDHDARPVYLASFLYFSGFIFFQSFIGILLVGRFSLSESDVGAFFGIVGAWIIFTQAIVLQIVTRKWRERQILRITIIGTALAIFLYPFMPTSAWVYGIIPLLAIPNGLSMVSMTALVSHSVSPQRQGAALGINSSLMALAQGSIPLFAGFASGFLGLSFPFFAGSLLALASWYILFCRKA